MLCVLLHEAWAGAGASLVSGPVNLHWCRAPPCQLPGWRSFLHFLPASQCTPTCAAGRMDEALSLATGATDNTARLWSGEGKLLRTLEGHTDRCAHACARACMLPTGVYWGGNGAQRRFA